MLQSLRAVAPRICLVFLALFAAPVFAQVPQDTTFTGRLVDDLGNPLTGPVNLELRIFDAETSGTQLYSEEHLGTALDATGGFSVQLGLGTSTSGPFDADLFLDVDRWLEVAVDAQVLAPRQIIGSVPWALIAQQANKIVPDPSAPRFEDCSDGTVADHKTGLQWEKKTGTVGSTVVCETAGCPDPHDVNNLYEWSNTAPDPDGGAFTDFLARLNGQRDPDAPTGCFAEHCDWELPKISELQTILIGPEAAPGQAQTCSAAPCIDPDFAAVGGPTADHGSAASGWHWSASTDAGVPATAWAAAFGAGVFSGEVEPFSKLANVFVRAVRAGSCN